MFLNVFLINVLSTIIIPNAATILYYSAVRMGKLHQLFNKIKSSTVIMTLLFAWY